MSPEIMPRALSSAALLSAWETARRGQPSVRALALLHAAMSDGDQSDPAKFCIGEGDAFLLGLRRLMFGSCLECTATCPACAAELELTLEVEDLLLTHGSGEKTYDVSLGTPAQVIFFRLPTHVDLQALPLDVEPVISRKFLVERCVLYAEHEGQKISGLPLSEEAILAVGKEMSRVDAQAEIVLNMTCPDCKYGWATTFDIVDFLWQEISARARRLLAEIHSLAQAYGWTESEILKLSDMRRQTYLELVDQ